MKTFFKLLIYLKTICIVVLLSGTLLAQPNTYLNAPPCRTDIDRNHSVFNAIQALNRAAAAPNYNAARNDLQTAWLNLEQVMNYGALQWSECMSCDPYKSINNDPASSYINVAWRLINLSRALTGNPNYNEYLGLVETIANNYQIDPYCGVYANQVNVDDIADYYEFGRVTPTKMILCGSTAPTSNFILVKNWGNMGRPLKSCHFNESFYWPIGNEMVFVDGFGAITSVLRKGGPDYWEGPYKADVSAGITHYIRRDNKSVPDPCKDPSWLNKFVPKTDAYLAEPPYGGSPWAKDGDRYWMLGGGSAQYFVVKGGNIHRFNRCGVLLAIHIREYTKPWDGGKQSWGGYTQMPDGSRGGAWYIVWE